MVPGIDKAHTFVEIVHRDDRQNRCEYLSRVVCQKKCGGHNPGYSLAHWGIVGTDVSDTRRSDIFRLPVSVSAENDSPLGIIQQFLYPIKAFMVWKASDDSGSVVPFG